MINHPYRVLSVPENQKTNSTPYRSQSKPPVPGAAYRTTAMLRTGDIDRLYLEITYVKF